MDKREKRKKLLHMANRVFNICLICVVIAFAVGKGFFEKTMPFLLPLLAVLAGGISFLNWKLPAKDRMRAKLSVSSFGIHPYVTFAALLIYNVLFFVARR